MVTRIDSVTECIECGSQNIILDKADNEVICKDCGAIFEPLLPEEENKLEKTRGLGFTKHLTMEGLFEKFKFLKKPKAAKKKKVKAKKKSKSKPKISKKRLKSAKKKPKRKSKASRR